MSVQDSVYQLFSSAMVGSLAGLSIDQLIVQLSEQLKPSEIAAGSRLPMAVGLIATELTLDALFFGVFFDFMSNRGESLNKGILGTAPFFIFFLQNQPFLWNHVNEVKRSIYDTVTDALNPETKKSVPIAPPSAPKSSSMAYSAQPKAVFDNLPYRMTEY